MRIRLGIILLGFLVFAPAAWAENKLAFVVGIDRYPHLGPESQLSRAVADAEAVGDALQAIGFAVTRVTREADLDTIINRFEAFKAALQPGDTVVFYYAGHGVSLDDGNYLIPADIPALGPNDERLAKRHALAERDIKQDLRAAGARIAVVVLDACRNNPFPQRGARALGAVSRGLARLEPQEGVFSLYSAREGQTALDRLSDHDTDRNSVFTRVFLRALQTPGLSLSALGDEVRDDVAALARAEGADQVPAVSNDLIGSRSVFLAGPAPVAALPLAPAPAVLTPAPPAVVATLPPARAAGMPLPAASLAAAAPSFEEAESLTAQLEAALSGRPDPAAGDVILSPRSDAYRASFDLKRIIEALVPGVDLAPATATLSLKHLGTRWQLASSALPRLSLRMGQVSLESTADLAQIEAIFDPALPGFAGGTWQADNTVLDVVAPPYLRRQRIGHSSLVETAAAAEKDATSIDLDYAMTDLANATLDAPSSPGAGDASTDAPRADAGRGITVTAERGTLGAHLEGLRLKSLIALRSFFMQHPRPEADAALAETLRGLLGDLLPVLTGARQNLAFDGVKLVLPGPNNALAAQKLAFDLDLAGVAASGHAALALSWDGFAVQGEKMPAWVADLRPVSGLIKPTLWGFHLGEAGRRTLDDFDFAKKVLPPGDGDAIARVALPLGGLQVLVEPSRIETPLLRISFEGEIDNLLADAAGSPPAGQESAKPAAHFTVSASGIDRVIARLQQASAGAEDGAAELLAQIQALKALGQPGPEGAMVWHVDFADNSLTVEGKRPDFFR